ncbi:hypothetical protein KI387_023254, partial [Taxus chinensis]
PDWVKANIASKDGIYVENAPLIREPDAFCEFGLYVGGRSGSVTSLLLEGEATSKSETCADLCCENGQQIELRGGIENAVAPSYHISVRDDDAEYKNKWQIEVEGCMGNFVAPSDTIEARDDTADCKNKPHIEFGGGIGNVVAQSDHKAVSDDTTEYKCVKRTMAESVAKFYTENKTHIELGGIMVNVVVPSELIAVKDDTRMCKLQERTVVESFPTLCTEKKQKIELVDNTASVSDLLDHIMVKDDTSEYRHGERTIAELRATFSSENKAHIDVVKSDFKSVRDDASKYEHQERTAAESIATFFTENKHEIEFGSNLGNVIALSERITLRDDTAVCKHRERTIAQSIAISCTEIKPQVEVGHDIINVVATSDLIGVIDNTSKHKHQETTMTESIVTLCTENMQQIELVGDIANESGPSDLIPVRDDTKYKRQNGNMVEATIPSKSCLPTRRLDGKETLWTVQDCVPRKDQNIYVTEREELDDSMSDHVQYQVSGSPLINMGFADKCVIKDQNIRQEHRIQVHTILSKVKPDETQDQTTKFNATSNACGRYPESSSLITGECTGHLKRNEDFDDFSPQPQDNCHPNACEQIDRDRQTNRTGPILRSRKIYLATSMVKKHQKRMMSSMSSEGGKMKKTTFISNRLKRNAVRGLFDDYLKDWMDKNVQTGSFENEHCLPFLVNAPKRVECFQCKDLVAPGKEIMCTVISCRKAYHLVCAEKLRGSYWFKKREFRCPHHVCMVCNSRQGLWRCVRCPVAVHRNCSPWPEAMIFLKERSRPAICWRHHEDWRLEHKRKDRTNAIKEAFLRLPVPYVIEDFKIEATFCQDVMGNENEPPPYVQIRRNVFLIKKKRDDTDDGVGCSCGTDAIVCGENCECRVQSMSCSRACQCSEMCTNKPFRKEKRIKIIKTKSCGWGAEAAEVIKRGEFVIEYAGEVINDALCEERLWEMKHRGVHNFYMCEIGKDFIIDATFKGNQSRFLNHSCDPNCKLEKWRVDGETRVGVFAAQDIGVGEPLTYDYRSLNDAQSIENINIKINTCNLQRDEDAP